MAEPTRPDLAIEVLHTAGGINKLEIDRRLDVREVWIWKRGRLQPYVLAGETYQAVDISHVLPGLDLAQLAAFIARFIEHPRTSQTIREYRAALRGEQG